MIQQLNIKNFQAHKDSEIKFSPGVNSIIGETDSGKSSILRTMNWIINNRPVGDAFRSHFAKNENTVGTLVIDDHSLSRIKGNKDNQYTLDEHEYKAIGTSDIPNDIKDFLNLSEINIQKQMDSPFLLSDTPGEVGRFLNQIVNLENIDASLKRIDSSIRKNKSDMAFNEAELKKSEADLKKIEWVVEAEKEFYSLQELVSDHQVKNDNYFILNNIIGQIKSIELPVYDVNKAEKQFNEIQKQISTRDDKVKEWDDLRHTVYKISEAQAKNIEYHVQEAEKELSKMEADQSQINYYIKNIAGIDVKIAELNLEQEIIQTAKKNILIKEKLLKKIMPDVCPVCGQEICNEKS